ncbi:MAG TPA: hypothetical protein VFS60_05105 [Thermoanaerobaculia bacterium]|nr:hypothetical protein [Thermoanaerobaculia bacterium]
MLLLALLVWAVGQRVERLPHPEIGVNGGSVPQGAHETPTPVERRADAPPQPAQSPVEQGSGGEPVDATSVPASPRP